MPTAPRAIAPTSPTSPTSGALRWARASSVAVTTVVVAVLAHHLAGGMVAPAWLLVSVAAGSSVLAHALSARRWTTPELVGVLVLAQAVLHLSCTVGDPMAMGASTSTPLMLAAHAGATAVTAAVLRHGETVLWSLVDVLAMRPFGLLTPVDVPVRTTGRWALGARVLPSSQVRAHAAPVRGPPA